MVGIKFGINSHMYPLEHVMKTAELAEKYGFDSLLIPDHIMQCEKELKYLTSFHAWTIISYWAAKTKKLIIGTGCSDPHRLHPVVLAQIVATVDQLSGGRALLALGGGERMNLEPYGIPWDKPIARMREALTIIDTIWTNPGPINFDGEFYHLKDAYRPLKPIQQPHPPVFIAANRPLSIKLLGEMGDGWFPIRLLPENYKKKLDEIRAIAKKAGRSPNAIEAGLFIRSACSERREEARSKAVMDEAKPSILYSPEKLEQEGINFKVPHEWEEFDHGNLLVKPEIIERRAEAAKAIPDDIVTRFYPFGTVSDCIETLDKYIKVGGTRHFFIMLIGPEELNWKTMRMYGEKIIPYFKETYKDVI